MRLLQEGGGSKVHRTKQAATQERIKEASAILAALGVPLGSTARQQEQQAMVFLAAAGLTPADKWSNCQFASDGRSLTTRDIIDFQNQHYEEAISRGSYDDVRRKHLIAAVEAGVVVRTAGPSASTNNPTRGYAVSDSFARIIHSADKTRFPTRAKDFMRSRPNLAEELQRKRDLVAVPVQLPNGREIRLTAGGHNELQRDIIELFLPRYGYSAEVWYVGDSTNKTLVVDTRALRAANLPLPEHDELPDVIAFSQERQWVYFIEAVHSSGEVSELRRRALLRMSSDCQYGVVFVTAFLSREMFRKFVVKIAWETEVWVSEQPDHLIHFNGGKFLGPYES